MQKYRKSIISKNPVRSIVELTMLSETKISTHISHL